MRNPGAVLSMLIVLVLRGAAALLLAVLLLLEPLIQPVLCAIALLALGTALFFRLLIGAAEFPFWGMVALSITCMLLLALYYRLMRLLYF